MQSISTPASALTGRNAARRRPRLLVVELWGLGDLALAMPFLRVAVQHADVDLLAKPHAALLLRRFCPEANLIPFTAPWTAFIHKYQLARWPWSEIAAVVAGLRSRRFDAAVSARHDPRDHALMALTGAQLRAGFSRVGSAPLLTDALPHPSRPHRAEYWRALSERLGWTLPATDTLSVKPGKRIAIHTGAGQPARIWPRERFEEIAAKVRASGWSVTVLDDSLRDLDTLLDTLAGADRFIGNDSGPGHLAALLGVPTFTLFGPSLPEVFHPVHPNAAWVEGRTCPYKPCRDYCRFSAPRCLRDIPVEEVWSELQAWLNR